jgi:hypothetical protein
MNLLRTINERWILARPLQKLCWLGYVYIQKFERETLQVLSSLYPFEFEKSSFALESNILSNMKKEENISISGSQINSSSMQHIEYMPSSWVLHSSLSALRWML